MIERLVCFISIVITRIRSSRVARGGECRRNSLCGIKNAGSSLLCLSIGKVDDDIFASEDFERDVKGS